MAGIDSRPPAVAVLGATGYSGRALLRHLAQLAPAWPVTALVRRVPEERLPFVRYVVGALPDAIPAGFPPPGTDVVVHLATEKQAADPDRLTAVNVAGTAALLSALPPGIAGIIYASSMSVYGQGEQLDATEDHPLRPDTPLALSRLRAEELITDHMRQIAVTAYLLRPRFLIGRHDPAFLPGIRRLSSLPLRLPPRAVRLSVIDVEDYAAVIARLACHAVTRFRRNDPARLALNVAYRDPVTLDRLYDLAGARSSGPGARPLGSGPGLPTEALISVCRHLPGRTALRLRTQLELVTRSHCADVSALEGEIGTDITGKDPVAVLRSYRDRPPEAASAGTDRDSGETDRASGRTGRAPDGTGRALDGTDRAPGGRAGASGTTDR